MNNDNKSKDLDMDMSWQGNKNKVDSIENTKKGNWFYRIYLYQKEMYPILSRLILGLIVFAEIYFIVLLNSGATLNFSTLEINMAVPTGGYSDGMLWDGVVLEAVGKLSIQELVGAFTVFSFLFWLRIADDFKDYELDCKMFPHRPLPSGRVTHKDLKILLWILIPITLALNLVFMNNFIFCFILYTYGSLMAIWFFQKHKIAKSLPLALVTHNPVQMIMNIYIISFVVIKYKPFVNPFSIYSIMAVFTLYFPALIWEVTRKIRAPKDETEYTTYSKLFGYKKATNFAMIVTWIDIITNFILVWNLSKISVLILFLLVSWMTLKFIQFKKDPTRFKLVDMVERYTYLQESIMLLTVILVLITQ